MAYQHIKISRDEPIVERPTRPGFGAARKFTLDEAKAHGAGFVTEPTQSFKLSKWTCA